MKQQADERAQQRPDAVTRSQQAVPPTHQHSLEGQVASSTTPTTRCSATWQRRSGQVTRVGERVGHSVGAQSRATTRPAWKTSSVSGALEPTTMIGRSSEAGPTCGFRCCGWGTTRGVHTQIHSVVKATGSLGGPLPLPYTHQSKQGSKTAQLSAVRFRHCTDGPVCNATSYTTHFQSQPS